VVLKSNDKCPSQRHREDRLIEKRIRPCKDAWRDWMMREQAREHWEAQEAGRDKEEYSLGGFREAGSS
jgi:hypothetical protein